MQDQKEQLHDTMNEIRVLAGFIAKTSRNDLERRLNRLEVGINAPHFYVLRLLASNQFTIKELSRKIGVEAASLVPVVDALENKGLVRRGQDARDRRRNPLTLTEAGQAVLDRLPLWDEEDILLKGLTELGLEKSDQLLGLLRQLADLLSEDQTELAELLSTVLLQKGYKQPVAGAL